MQPSQSRARSLQGSLMLVAAATGWGTWSLFFKPAEALGPVAPQLEYLAAMLGMVAVFVPLAILRRGKKQRPSSAWWGLLAFGVADAVNGLLFFQAMQTTTIAIAVLTHCTAPLLVAALSPVILKEKPQPGLKLALGLALGGLVLLLEPWGSPAQGALLGAFYGLASAVLYATEIFVSKKISESFTPFELTGYHAVPAVLILGLAVPSGGFALTTDQMLILGAAGLGPGAMSAFFFMAGLGRVQASTAAVIVLLEPLVATLIGVFVWGEPMGVVGALGAALMLWGMLLTLRHQTPH